LRGIWGILAISLKSSSSDWSGERRRRRRRRGNWSGVVAVLDLRVEGRKKEL
jgi:hypothetical protein